MVATGEKENREAASENRKFLRKGTANPKRQEEARPVARGGGF